MRVPAKINLSLGVGRVRPDGFHPLATVYQAVDLHDELRIGERDDNEITVAVHTEFDLPEGTAVPVGDDNIAVHAAKLLRERLGRDDLGADIAIRKIIPVAGGMAGGSADAAATLVGLNELWGGALSREDLEPLAAELGSDVPFLLHGGNAIGGGRGEKVSPVLARGTYHWVLATASEGLSTAAVYAEFDRLNPEAPVEPEVPDELLNALRAGDANALGKALSNDLTEAAVSLRPELADSLQVGLEAGALGAIVSGSGPTTAFLVASEQHGLDLAMALAAVGTAADVIQSRGPVGGARLI